MLEILEWMEERRNFLDIDVRSGKNGGGLLEVLSHQLSHHQ
jgi:hypothetical protein